ncbi:hypothetical protein ACO0LM_01565 [Undibacterium sp. Di26W]|uniref:hypothetical protein n=1 Tax=Undibacterium sp. Di26W TaxID=3413035 RepID=UPI003BEFA110
MTRILYWNVNNFSLSKIQAGGALGPTAASRRHYMTVGREYSFFRQNTRRLMIYI